MGAITIDGLIPARAFFSEKLPLNVLVVANNPDTQPRTQRFCFYANAGSGWREIFAQEKKLAPNGHSHIYFQIPAHCFGADFWGEQPDELTLCAAFAPPEQDGGLMLYYKPAGNET